MKKHNDKICDVTNEIDKVIHSAPLYQQMTDWFRDKHNLIIEIGLEDSGLFDYLIGDTITKKVIKRNYLETEKLNITYYSALNQAIEESFKLI